MANWSTLKAAIANIIKTNGNQEITGQLLQNVLNNIVSSVGENSTFAGIATPTTNPGVPDGNVFYLATEAGTYSNFSGIEVASGEAVILEWRGSWVKKTSGFATEEKVKELSSKTVLGVPYTPLGKGNGASPSNELYANKYFGIKTANGIIICTPATSNLSIIKFNYKTKEETVIKTVEKSELVNGINTIYFDNTVVLTDDELIATRGAVIYYSGGNKVTGIYMINKEGILSSSDKIEIQIQILTEDNLKDISEKLTKGIDNINKAALKSSNLSVEEYIVNNRLTNILDLPKGIYRTNNSDDLVNYGLPIKGYGALLKYTYQSTIIDTGYTVYYYHVSGRMFYTMTNIGDNIEDIVWIEVANKKAIDNLFNNIFEQTYTGNIDEVTADSYSASANSNNIYFNVGNFGFTKIYGIWVQVNSLTSPVQIYKYSFITKEVTLIQEIQPSQIKTYEYFKFGTPIIINKDYEVIGVKGYVLYNNKIGSCYEFVSNTGLIQKISSNVTVAYIPVGDSIKDKLENNADSIHTLTNNINSLKDKELIGIRSNIAMLPSPVVVDVNHFWFNDFKPKNGKVTGIVYKNHIGGIVHFFKVKCTSLWSENISDGNVPVTKAIHDIVTINTAQYEEGELVLIPVSIQLEEDEYIGVYGDIYFGKTANCGYSQRCVDGRVDKDYTIGYWLLTDKEYPNTKYIEIFKDNFQSKDLYNWIFNGVWNEVEGSIQAGANGETNYMRSNRIYHYDKRKMRLKISCGSDSVIRAFCSYGSNMNSGNGATGVILDFASKKLTLCKTGDGTDEQLWGATIQFDQELTSSNFPEKFGDAGDYIIELEKDELNILCTVYDCKTGNSVSVSHEGWAAGRLNQYFGVCPMSGTSIILKEFTVIALYNPDIVVAGDSISEGEGTTDKLNKYTSRLRKDLPNKSIVLSARGGANINDVFNKFLTEYVLLKPKCIIVLIGENGGNTLAKLKLLGNLASIFGIKLFINYCTPSNYVDNQQQNNRWIDTLENKGARFDMALSKDNYPWVDDEHPAPIANLSLYSDNYRHPNDLGHEAMYKRLRIDLPILYDL